MRLAQFMEFPLRVIRMRLDLHDRRLDSSGIDDLPGAFGVDIGQAYRSRQSLVDEGLHGGPCFRNVTPPL